MQMPDVLKAEKEVVEFDQEEWKVVKSTVDNAIEAFQKFREDEGKTLSTEFETRINIIDKLFIIP